jgi:succinoglycan biosynthesis transport protein ExoP
MQSDSVDERQLPPLFDLRALWDTVWERRLIVLAITGGALLLAIFYVAVTAPTYTATASLLVDPRDSRATNLNDVLPGIGADSAAIASQVSVIESQDLLDDVFEQQAIEHDPEYSGSGILSTIVSVFTSRPAVPRTLIFKRFESRLSVQREGLTYVIDVSFTSNDPVKAARIANAIVDRYKASLAGDKEAANSEVNSLLGERIGGLQQSVSDAERAVEDFKVKHKIVAAGAGGTLQSQIDQLSAQILVAQAEADQAGDRYRQAVAAGASPSGLVKLSAILSSTATEKLRDAYNRGAAELANSETTYGPRHPAIAKLQSELNKIKGLMAVEAVRITSELKAKNDLAVQSVATLQRKLEELRGQSNQSDVSQVQLRQLERQADAARAVLDDFLKRAAETSQMRGLQMSQVRVISAAVPPVQPTWPKPLLLLPVSAVLGLVTGCGIALTLGPVPAHSHQPPSRLDTNRQGGGEHRNGNIAPPPSRPAFAQELADWGTYTLRAIPPGTTRGSVNLIRTRAFQPGFEPLSQSVLDLLWRILGRLGKRAKPLVLVVSSIGDGPERTLAAAMIGIGLQHAGEKVLVVELSDSPDPRAARVSPAMRAGRVFVDASSGLPTVVRGTTSAKNKRPFSDAGALHKVLAEAGGGFDFMVVVDRPMTEGKWSPPALAADADLVLFALTHSEVATEAAAALRECLSPAELDRSAMFVVAPGADQPALGAAAARGPANLQVNAGWREAFARS